VESQGLTVEQGPLRVTIEHRTATGGLIWELARGAFDGAERALEKRSVRPIGNRTVGESQRDDPSSTDDDGSDRRGPRPRRDSKAQQVRAIAYTVLADGEPHERREIARLVREHGIDPKHINYALEGRFEKTRNEAGRPCYRDPAADPDEPEWMRRWNEDQIAGAVAALGCTPDRTYLDNGDGAR
jgi:hypothetical protein